MSKNNASERKLWQIVTDHPDIFDTHVVTKLNGNDVKFFYDVNTESRAAIQRSGARLPDAFKIGEFHTKSTLSWALEKCSEKRERFCAEMALETWLKRKGLLGHLECLKYAHENGCPWDERTCFRSCCKKCLKYAHLSLCCP